MNGWQDTTAGYGDSTVDTVALLHEEIARLEGEILARDAELTSVELSSRREVPPGFEDPAHYRLTVERLTAELAAKDETVELLLEQCRFYEEAAAVRRSEWEQVREWVEEVERRVGDGGEAESRHREELHAERGRFENLARRHDSDRRAWEVQRRGLDQELVRFRELVAQKPESASAGAALSALEAENREHRARLVELEHSAAGAAALRERLAATVALLDAARVEVRQSEDERRREACEHEAALNSLRNQAAREALAAAPAPPAENEGAKSTAVEADERIRAFRQHLQELHRREAEERTARGGLSTRLSRIWRHAGPGR